MIRVRLIATLGFLIALGGAAGAVRAQAPESKTVGTLAMAAHTQSFDFGAQGDVQTARLLLFPATFQRSVGGRMALDGYAAYGIGTVKSGGVTSKLEGPVDSWLRLRWAANRWAVVALGVALPTGVSRHTTEQAIVANTLSSELLGFREGNWGGGGSATLGISTAFQAGGSRFTLGSSYRAVRSFQPSADTTVIYQPGNEAKVHAGIEHTIGGGQFFLGATAQRFGADKANSKNLFQSGARYRGDLSYSSGHWSFFAADLWRARGELTLPVVDAFDGAFLRDTSLAVGWQNLGVAGLTAVITPGPNFSIVPAVTFKTLSREDRTGRGWLASGGLTFPARIGDTEFFPSVKLNHGRLAPSATPRVMQPFWGAEVSFVIRRSSLRPRVK